MPELGVAKHGGKKLVCQDRQEAFPQWMRWTALGCGKD